MTHFRSFPSSTLHLGGTKADHHSPAGRGAMANCSDFDCYDRRKDQMLNCSSNSNCYETIGDKIPFPNAQVNSLAAFILSLTQVFYFLIFLSMAIPFVSFCCYLKLQSLKYKMALLIFLQGSFWLMALGCLATPILHRLNLVEIPDGRCCLVWGSIYASQVVARWWCWCGAWCSWWWPTPTR